MNETYFVIYNNKDDEYMSRFVFDGDAEENGWQSIHESDRFESEEAARKEILNYKKRTQKNLSVIKVNLVMTVI